MTTVRCSFNSDQEAVYTDSRDGMPVCLPCAQLVASNEPALTWTVLATGRTVNYPSGSYAPEEAC